MRSRRASALKPANTTECTAPMRAQASITKHSSGTMGMYTATVSPLRTPDASIAFAIWHTCACSSAKVTVRPVPGSSPSQMIAALLAFVAKCRSTQQCDAFSFPSKNHSALPPPSDPRCTCVNGEKKVRYLLAASFQNASGSDKDAACFVAYSPKFGNACSQSTSIYLCANVMKCVDFKKEEVPWSLYISYDFRLKIHTFKFIHKICKPIRCC